MEDINNISQQSSLIDLTLSPNENINFNSCNILDRPPKNFGKMNNLRSIQELPVKYRSIFSFPFFNIIQSNILDDVLYSDASIVVSSPTGSGKTVIFELAIIRLLMKFEEEKRDEDFKIVYVAPVKTLCNERLSEWHSKFSSVGLPSIVVTGDSDNFQFQMLQNYKIIITTPEKWDSLTRNIKDARIIDSLKLFMIDEVHLLNEETRGPILEAIVSRMKILKKGKIRFVAVSATIPNIEDVAEWLGFKENDAVHFKIGEDLRPVKLNKVVLGYPCATPIPSFKFDLTLNYKLPSVIMQYSDGKPTLIFCSTRKGVELTSKHISQSLSFHPTPEQFSLLESAAQTMYDSKMKQQLSSGVGSHHAGMSPENRSTVENLFREGILPVLVTTSTLAMGVNLPAHLVIVKNTRQYINGEFQDYNESSLVQMIGRAGRPQFDRSATVVIMTTNTEKSRYEKFLGGTELIESNLHRHLSEYLNAEIALKIITDIGIALEWIRYTFLYIRVLKNPKHYNMPANLTKDKIEKRLQDLCQIEINALNKHGMLEIDQTDGFSVYPTNMGILMANYCLAFNTMKLFSEVNNNESLSNLLLIISRCHEFSESYLRVSDKKTLNILNRCKYQNTIRFPLPGNIKTTPMKVNCIIQATFGCLRIQNPSLYQESLKIMRIGERITKSLVIYLEHKNTYFTTLLNALTLNQCFNAKLWENSKYVSRQLNKIGNVLSSMLVTAGKTSFKALLETNPRDLERIINRAPPMGNTIHETVSHLPFYRINMEPPQTNNIFEVKVIVTLLNAEDVAKDCTAGRSYMTLLVGDSENNVLFYKKLYHHSLAISKNFTQNIKVSLKKTHVIYVHLISENWVGIDCQNQFDIIVKEENSFTLNSKEKLQTNFEINKKTITKNSSDISSYFTSTKNKNTNCSNNKNLKLCAPIVAKTNTIDSYFQKQKKDNTNETKTGNANLSKSSKINGNNRSSPFVFRKNENLNTNLKDFTPKLSTPKIFTNNSTVNINNEDSFTSTSINGNQNWINVPNIPNFSQMNEENLNLSFLDPNFDDLREENLQLNDLSFVSYKNVNENKFYQPKNFNQTENNCEEIVDKTEPLLMRRNKVDVDLSQQNFEKFSEHLAKKFRFPAPSEKTNNLTNQKIISSSFSQPAFSKYQNNSNKSTHFDSTLNLHQFKYTPRKLLSHINLNENETFDDSFVCNEKAQMDLNKTYKIKEIVDSSPNNVDQKKKFMNKPYFPKTFREYVENNVKKLEESTLKNEYCNYDFGFREFLLDSLDSKSDEESCNNKEENEDSTDENINLNKILEDNNEELQFNFDTFTSENDFSFDKNLNATFSSNNFDSFEDVLENHEPFPKINSEKIENRFKIIERYYNKQMPNTENEENISPTIVPFKKRKFTDTNAKNISFVPRKDKEKHDSLKNMFTLKNVLNNYGNKFGNRVTISNKPPEHKQITQPTINQVVQQTAYTYSIQKLNEEVKMSVTVLQKENKSSFLD